jgi:uncharacterized protein HemX
MGYYSFDENLIETKLNNLENCTKNEIEKLIAMQRNKVDSIELEINQKQTKINEMHEKLMALKDDCTNKKRQLDGLLQLFSKKLVGNE